MLLWIPRIIFACIATKIIASYPLWKLLTKIYTAGGTIEEAGPNIEKFLKEGFDITSDILGEFVKNTHDVAMVMLDYMEHIEWLGALQKKYPERQISLAVKPSRIGLEINYILYAENLNRLAREAEKHGVFLWVDAEKKEFLERETSGVIYAKMNGNDNIGEALQTVHSDARNKLARLLSFNIPVRFVKGAYRDGDLKNRDAIRENFKNIFWTACQYYKNAKPPVMSKYPLIAVATHDSILIDYALKFNADPDIGRFIQNQMLKGVRPFLQRELVMARKKILIYIPHGKNRFRYLWRRFKEGISFSAIWMFVRNIYDNIKFAWQEGKL